MKSNYNYYKIYIRPADKPQYIQFPSKACYVTRGWEPTIDRGTFANIVQRALVRQAPKKPFLFYRQLEKIRTKYL